MKILVFQRLFDKKCDLGFCPPHKQGELLANQCRETLFVGECEFGARDQFFFSEDLF